VKFNGSFQFEYETWPWAVPFDWWPMPTKRMGSGVVAWVRNSVAGPTFLPVDRLLVSPTRAVAFWPPVLTLACL